jgi:predicted secreted protein
MRTVIGVVLFVVLVFQARAADPKPIVVGVGQEFEIVLDSPADSSRHWLLSKPLDENLLKEAGRDYRRRPPAKGHSGICEVLRYRALTKGKAEVHLKFASLFEREQPATLRTNFVVLITDKATKP